MFILSRLLVLQEFLFLVVIYIFQLFEKDYFDDNGNQYQNKSLFYTLKDSISDNNIDLVVIIQIYAWFKMSRNYGQHYTLHKKIVCKHYLSLTKCSRKMLQNLLLFIHLKTHAFFNFILSNFIFSLLNALIFVDTELGNHKGKSNVT